jgi:hypothetical protein
LNEILVLSDKEDSHPQLMALLSILFPDCRIRIVNNQRSEMYKPAEGGDDAKPLDDGKND